jgi:hypothetical protein
VAAIAIDDSISKLVAVLVSTKPSVAVRCALLDVLGTQEVIVLLCFFVMFRLFVWF